MIFFNVDRTIFKRNILFVNCEKSSKQKKHKLKKNKKTPLATRTLAILQGKYSRVRTFNAIVVVVVVHTSQVIWGFFLLQMLTLNEKKKVLIGKSQNWRPQR